ncbi:MAG: hypothetical protein VKK04_20545 [Synechococcales bacterium]|nr:hypothetical protein [Synechococcales bacterium]
MPENLYSAPYFLLAAGLFASITSGLAFSATLKASLKEWSDNRTTRRLSAIRGVRLLIPFLGICGGVCVFLASGVQIFAFSPRLSYAIALPLTVLSGLLVWVQLGQLLRQFEKSGAKAFEMNFFE